MSDRIASSILQLLLAIFLILYGIAKMLEQHGKKDEPFGEYQNLADCIRKNWNKRDPEQYCLKIKRKVETARRRKYGR